MKKLTQSQIIEALVYKTAEELAENRKSPDDLYLAECNLPVLLAMVKRGTIVRDSHWRYTLNAALLAKYEPIIRSRALAMQYSILEARIADKARLQAELLNWRTFQRLGYNKQRFVMGDYEPQVSDRNTFYFFSYRFNFADRFGAVRCTSTRPFLEVDHYWLIEYEHIIRDIYASMTRIELSALPAIEVYTPGLFNN